jgi:hypothetical protein
VGDSVDDADSAVAYPVQVARPQRLDQTDANIRRNGSLEDSRAVVDHGHGRCQIEQIRVEPDREVGEMGSHNVDSIGVSRRHNRPQQTLDDASLGFSIGLALAAAYFAETKALDPKGLGVIGQRASLDQTSGAEVLWTTIFCTAALGIAGLVALTIAERTLLRWHSSQR